MYYLPSRLCASLPVWLRTIVPLANEEAVLRPGAGENANAPFLRYVGGAEGERCKIVNTSDADTEGGSGLVC